MLKFSVTSLSHWSIQLSVGTGEGSGVGDDEGFGVGGIDGGNVGDDTGADVGNADVVGDDVGYWVSEKSITNSGPPNVSL